MIKNLQKKFFLYSALCFLLIPGTLIPAYSAVNIHELKSLDRNDITLKSVRADIQLTIKTIRGKKTAEDMPELRIYRYKVKKDDSFWTIISQTSLDIDTLASLNTLVTPGDIEPGRTIYIPNMRGIVKTDTGEKALKALLKDSGTDEEYFFKANKCSTYSKEAYFIPGGKMSRVERSLFLGSGFRHPLNGGVISSDFGYRKNPFHGRNYQFHGGIDIACRLKTEVLAARSGKVVFTGNRGNYGRLVIIEHENGYSTYYGHLSVFYVKKGSLVKQGQVIALSGNSGRTTGPHLHFEIRKNTRRINPGPLLLRL